MSDAILVAIITAGTTIIVQLLINKQNNEKNNIEQAKRDQKLDDKLEHIDTKLEEHNGYAKMFSPLPFRDVDISHIKGNIDNKDTNISMICVEILSNLIFENMFLQIILFPLKT